MKSKLHLLLFTVFLLTAVGCKNPLAGEKSGSEIDSSFHPGVPSSGGILQNFSLNIPFTAGTDSSYLISDSSRVELLSGVARLKPANQTDSVTNTLTSSGGFLDGSMSGVQWDSSNGYVRLNSNLNNVGLDSSWAPQWSSLIGYYPLNGNFNDYSGNGRNGAGNGGLGFTASCQVGAQCAIFDGSTNYFSVAHNNAFQLNGSYTISMWVYPNNWPGYAGLLTKGDGNGTGWFMYLGGKG